MLNGVTCIRYTSILIRGLKILKPNLYFHFLTMFLYTYCPLRFSEVTFFSVFIADVMTSMVKVFSDLAYTACYFGR